MFQIKSTDSTLFRPTTTLLSTVVLPFPLPDGRYETCIFKDGESEVVERYETMAEAFQGHVMWERKLKLRRISE